MIDEADERVNYLSFHRICNKHGDMEDVLG